MSLNKKSVDDINVKGLRVLCRCDFNVPLKNGEITDENRLVAALPTIKKLIADGGKVILCSHLGKVKTEEDKQTKTLAPVAKRLTELLGQEVKFVPSLEVVDDTVRAAVDAMKDGEVILLENTRFRAEETKNGEAFSKDLASICDVFVNDAFGTAHRAHCSNVGVAALVDTAVVGYLMQKEIDFLGNAVENPVRPFVAILGGAKVADKLNVISNLLEKCDTLIIGGGMAYTFLKAKGYEIGKSLVDETKLDYCKEMMEKAEKLGKKVIADKGFMDAIMDENAWELAGEGVRKFDLIRWNELSNKIDEFKEAYKECVNLADQAGGYPSKVYYKYKTTAVYADQEIDMNSINWYEKPSSTSGFESKDFWGKELNDSKGQEQLTINLPSISSGLNKEVKNRYLLPIASTTISTSNGNLYNSYGYAN